MSKEINNIIKIQIRRKSEEVSQNRDVLSVDANELPTILDEDIFLILEQL